MIKNFIIYIIIVAFIILLFGCADHKQIKVKEIDKYIPLTEEHTTIIEKQINIPDKPENILIVNKPIFYRCGSRVCLDDANAIKLIISIHNLNINLDEYISWGNTVCSDPNINCIGESNVQTK